MPLEPFFQFKKTKIFNKLNIKILFRYLRLLPAKWLIVKK